MSETPEITQWLERWRAGDQDAAAALFHLYSRKLTVIAQRQLSQQIASRVDGEDVVQSAMRTFFRRSQRGDFRIDNSAGLWRLLVKITVAKAKSQARRHTAEKRNVGSERSIDQGGGEHLLLTHDPTPAEAAALIDVMQAIAQGLPAKYAEILGLRLAGHTRSEVAEMLEITRQTVYRALEIMQQRLDEQMSAAD